MRCLIQTEYYCRGALYADSVCILFVPVWISLHISFMLTRCKSHRSTTNTGGCDKLCRSLSVLALRWLSACIETQHPLRLSIITIRSDKGLDLWGESHLLSKRPCRPLLFVSTVYWIHAEQDCTVCTYLTSSASVPPTVWLT